MYIYINYNIFDYLYIYMDILLKDTNQKEKYIMKKLIIALISSAFVVSFLIAFIDVSTPKTENNNDEVIY